MGENTHPQMLGHQLLSSFDGRGPRHGAERSRFRRRARLARYLR
jgi:hypothetical protein